MNSFHQKLHERALFTAREYLKRESELIGILQELDRGKTYRYFSQPSLYAYATQTLGLSESAAYALINVARKSVLVPELKKALEEKKITLSKARRIAPILNLENKSEWIEKAAALTQNKLEYELAKSFPERPSPTRVVAKSEILSRLELDLPHATLVKLKRAQEILAQKRQKHVALVETLDVLFDEFLTRNDPIEKAKRAAAKPPTKAAKLVLKPVVPVSKPVARIPLPANLKHALALRDQARCTHLHADGARCESTRWLQIHHLKPVALGGSNALINLKTLCSGHHKAEHL